MYKDVYHNVIYNNNIIKNNYFSSFEYLDKTNHDVSIEWNIIQPIKWYLSKLESHAEHLYDEIEVQKIWYKIVCAAELKFYKN